MGTIFLIELKVSVVNILTQKQQNLTFLVLLQEMGKPKSNLLTLWISFTKIIR